MGYFCLFELVLRTLSFKGHFFFPNICVYLSHDGILVENGNQYGLLNTVIGTLLISLLKFYTFTAASKGSETVPGWQPWGLVGWSPAMSTTPLRGGFWPESVHGTPSFQSSSSATCLPFLRVPAPSQPLCQALLETQDTAVNRPQSCCLEINILLGRVNKEYARGLGFLIFSVVAQLLSRF